LNVCINGDCSLPGETSFLDKDCKTSVSVFTVDYDAPDASTCSGNEAVSVRNALEPLVQYANSTATFVGGLNGTFTIFGNTTGTSSNSPTTSAPSSILSSAAVMSVGNHWLALSALLLISIISS
jgi:hypothetical protein